jgi:hypothetical protein
VIEVSFKIEIRVACIVEVYEQYLGKIKNILRVTTDNDDGAAGIV